MTLKPLCLALIVAMLVTSPARAQSNVAVSSGDAILFVWNDTLFAHDLASDLLITVQEGFTSRRNLPLSLHGNSFDFLRTVG